MLTHEEMVGLQSEKHELVDAQNFRSREEYLLYLIHSFAYVQASRFAEDKTILDLGCNTGYGSEILFKKAKKVVGVDVSKEAISSALKQYDHLDIDFKLIDGKYLPFNDNEFDVVISCQVVEHIVDYNLYLNELKRVITPLGIAIFTTPNALLRLEPGMKPWNIFHVREFEHSELQMLMADYFSTVQVMGLFAKEPLYQIERNRLSRARDVARKRQRYKHYDQFRSAIERMISTSNLNKLRKLFAFSSQSNKPFDEQFAEQYGHNDLYYRTDNLDKALDLLAVCTDDTGTSDKVRHILK